MMQFLQNLLENTDAPLFYALILGLLTAISPCQFARNITAIGYVSRDIQNMTKVFVNGLYYALGNAAGYSSIGIILFLGASKFNISRVLVTYGNLLMGLLLIFVGLFMLEVFKFGIPGGGWFMKKIQKNEYMGNKLDSALLGFLFALSFCPYNAALFFGMLIPLTITSDWGLFIPAVYSLAAGVPVLIIAYLLAFGVAGIGSFYNKVRVFQIWFNRLVASIFIATGIYFLYQFLSQRIFNM